MKTCDSCFEEEPYESHFRQRPKIRHPLALADADGLEDAVTAAMHIVLMLCLMSSLALCGMGINAAIKPPEPDAQMAEASPSQATIAPPPAAARVTL